MPTGGNLRGNPAKQRKGILRKIVGLKYADQKTDMFNRPWVVLECGHIVQSDGMNKARCPECLEAQAK